MDSDPESGLSERSYSQTLQDLAASCGIEAAYRDNWGHIQQTTDDTRLGILQALGIDAGTQDQAAAALRKRALYTLKRMTDPVIVASVSNPPETMLLRLPRKNRNPSTNASTHDWDGILKVTGENGVAKDYVLASQKASLAETIQVENEAYDSWYVPFPQLPHMGYYRFHLTVKSGSGERSETVFVALCPDKAYVPEFLQGEKRVAGLAISLYGVRSRRNWGVGDFGDLKKIVDWVVDDLHGNVVGLNPLHATFNRRPFNTSPYLPMSRFYRNFVYIDVPAMGDYDDAVDARAMVNAPETQAQLADLRTSRHVLYEEVAALKERVLREIFRTFLTNHWTENGKKTARQRAFEDYIESEGRFLDNFAVFCALDRFIRSKEPDVWTWREWPTPYRRPDTEEVERFRSEHWREILFHKWVQWQIEEQLSTAQAHAKDRGMCLGLYHDLALAGDRFSADSWAYQDDFLSGLRVGAPPDAFSQQGQDWGVLPPNADRLREAGYDLFIKEIQKNCQWAGALRIDHVMRFFHLYCIPEGRPPTAGAYMSQPFEDLLRIVNLESVRNEVLIIGEDLGTVSGHVRETLRNMNMLSYRLMYFERDGGQGFLLPQDYPELSLVAITTHDLPTLAGFWKHRDIEVREKAGLFQDGEAARNAAEEREADKTRLLARLKDLKLISNHSWQDGNKQSEITGDLHRAVVEFLARTPSKIFMLTQEDLFKEVDQQNLPGTTVEYPNWCLKMKYSLEQLRDDPEAQDFGRMFKTVVDHSGRHQCMPQG